MARNVIQSEFQTSKMPDGSHFVKKSKKKFVLIWNGQKCSRKWFSDIQNGRRHPFCKKITKIRIVVMIWNGKKSDTVIFGHPKWLLAAIFKKNIYKESCSSDLKNVRTDCWPTTTWYKFTFGQYIYTYIQTAMLGTREYTLCSPFRANPHNSSSDITLYYQ